ncbi:MAG: hypothetical protein AB1601_14000 [Planctomycetota bacterium]
MSEDRKDRRGFFEGFRQSPAKYTVACVLLVGFAALTGWRALIDPGRSTFWPLALVVLFVVILFLLFREPWAQRPEQRTAVERARRLRDFWGALALAGLWQVVLGTVMLIGIVALTSRTPTSPPQPPPPNATPESHEMYQRYLRVHQECDREQWYMYAKVSLFPLGSAALAILMFSLWRRAGRAVRRAEGRCERCGYSLQGLFEPRCPECGTPFTP